MPLSIKVGASRAHAIAVLIQLLAIGFLFTTRSAQGQAHQAARADRDTLPGNVARRALEAYNRHDVTALTAFYDTVTVHEMLGDSASRVMGTPGQMVGSLSDYFAKNKVRAELKQQLVSGRFVVQLYDFIENGKRAPHLDIYEVRHGKIVHEWDQGP
jgi:hypothetical protein